MSAEKEVTPPELEQKLADLETLLKEAMKVIDDLVSCHPSEPNAMRAEQRVAEGFLLKLRLRKK